MRASYERWSIGEVATLLGIAAVFALIVFAVYVSFQESARCNAKGGTFYCGNKSTCVCLAPGIVIPMGDQ